MKIKTRRYYLYYLLKTLLYFISFLPLKASLVLSSWLGRAAYNVLGKYREITERNLQNAFGISSRKSRVIAKSVFINIAKNGAEWIKLLSLRPEELDLMVDEIEGEEYLREYIEEKKGGIFLASHFGNWELMAAFLSYKSYKGDVVARRIYFHKYDRLITRLRNRFGVGVIYRDSSPKKMLRLIKNGKFLGILADQDVDSVEGIFVDFFGNPAYTPTAPVKIALASGSDLIPVFLLRKKNDKHKLVVKRPIKLVRDGDKKRVVEKYTRQWSGILEDEIRKSPEQWVWVHDRWKTSAENLNNKREGTGI